MVWLAITFIWCDARIIWCLWIPLTETMLSVYVSLHRSSHSLITDNGCYQERFAHQSDLWLSGLQLAGNIAKKYYLLSNTLIVDVDEFLPFAWIGNLPPEVHLDWSKYSKWTALFYRIWWNRRKKSFIHKIWIVTC